MMQLTKQLMDAALVALARKTGLSPRRPARRHEQEQFERYQHRERSMNAIADTSAAHPLGRVFGLQRWSTTLALGSAKANSTGSRKPSHLYLGQKRPGR